MKKPIFLLITLVLLAIGTAHSDTTYVENLENFARYSVQSSSNSTNAWFNADYSESFNYHIEQGSTFLVNFTDTGDSEQMVSISVGNLTRTDITDAEAAENLILNYYELKGELGFLANTSWSKLEQAFNGIALDDLEIDTTLRSYLGRTLETIRFHFISGGQNTTLIYEQRSGVLLEAMTGFNAFQLSFVIEATDLIPDYEISSTSDSPLLITMVSLSLVFLVVIQGYRKSPYNSGQEE